MNLISVDVETTSDDVSQGHILSIGMVKIYENGKNIYRTVNFSEGVFIKPAAMKVNGITFDQMDDNSFPSLDQLDDELTSFVDRNAVMIGRGAGPFDSQFIKKDLPKTFSLFNKIVFDLYAYLYGICNRLDLDPVLIKKQAMDYAIEKTNLQLPHLRPHHALWDSVSNIYFLEYLNTR